MTKSLKELTKIGLFLCASIIFPLQTQATEVSVQTGPTTMQLTWAANADADIVGYRVYYDADESGYPYANSVSTGSTTASYALDPDGANPVAFWNFDGTTEDWAFGAMGELRNGAVFTDDSYEGQALDLTDGGNQHMHVASASALNIAASIDEVTITFWQKLNSTPNTSSFWAFSPTTSAGGRSMQAHVPWGNGNIYWDTAGCCNGGAQRINANATGNQIWREWNHYAFVKSGSYKAIYVNGELFHDGDNSAPLPTDITYLNVGGGRNGNNSVRGAIDDFAIFAASLDEDQIYAIYEGDRSLYPIKPSSNDVTITGLSTGTTYYVAVAAIDSDGNES